MDLARAVAGDIVADLEDFREVGAGTLGRVVLGLFDARRRRTEQKVLKVSGWTTEAEWASVFAFTPRRPKQS